MTSIKRYTLTSCNNATLNNLGQDTVCSSTNVCLCLDNSDNLFFRNKIANSNSDTLYVSINKCNPAKRKCSDDVDKETKNFYVFIGMKNSYVDTNNYESPIKHFNDIRLVQCSSDNFKKIFVSITNNTLTSDNMDGY